MCDAEHHSLLRISEVWQRDRKRLPGIDQEELGGKERCDKHQAIFPTLFPELVLWTKILPQQARMRMDGRRQVEPGDSHSVVQAGIDELV